MIQQTFKGLFSCSLFVLCGGGLLLGQGTTFTYRGVLSESGSPVSGDHDFTFALFDSLTEGSIVGASNVVEEVPVAAGSFVVDLDFGSEAFTGARLWIEIAVRPAASGGAYVTLAPRQEINSVPYAVFAGGVRASGINGTIPPGSIGAGTIGGSQIAAGAVGVTQLAPGAVVDSLNAAGQSGVPSGGTVLSAERESQELMNAGYAMLGSLALNGTWTLREGNWLGARQEHSAVWTGLEVIVWGGRTSAGTPQIDGIRYYPSSPGWWRPLSAVNRPAARFLHSAVWTGTEMIVWGGFGAATVPRDPLTDGARYHPQLDTWTPVSQVGAPSQRVGHATIWTGTELILWGGADTDGYDKPLPPINTGARYHPSTDTWTPMSTTGAPSGRRHFSAVWTGTEMIVWGGWGGTPPSQVYDGYFLYDGGKYNPATDTWQPLTLTGAPPWRMQHLAVWTGSRMLVWGGHHHVGGSSPAPTDWLNDLGSYDPLGDIWALPSQYLNSSPSGRGGALATWTGSEMLIWGAGMGDGGLYDPVANQWRPIPFDAGPGMRVAFSAVWTGSSLEVFGGSSFTSNGTLVTPKSPETWSYIPGKTLYLYQRP